MNPETPILMITLQIPVTPDTTADEVLDAIGRQVSDALQDFRQQQNGPALESRAIEEFRASVPKETQEHFSEDTRVDLLRQMGYKTRR